MEVGDSRFQRFQKRVIASVEGRYCGEIFKTTYLEGRCACYFQKDKKLKITPVTLSSMDLISYMILGVFGVGFIQIGVVDQLSAENQDFLHLPL